MSLRILHLIPELGGGGGRAALAAASAASTSHRDEHRFASLRPAVPSVASAARAQGFAVLDAPEPARLLEEIERCDIAHLHFWCSPEIDELLESELPPCRLLLWPHVAGHSPPQIVPPALIERADLVVASSERSAAWIGRVTGTKPEIIQPVPGWGRVDGAAAGHRTGFHVGYLGTVGQAKLHPEFARLSAAVRVEDARFIVCGTGDAARSVPRQVAKLGISSQFEFRGQVEDIGAAFADFDVFGYPIRIDTYASSDMVLKEAMYAGVPPVVLPHGGCEDLVENEVTGLVTSTDGYPRAIERLYENPAERGRLAASAHEHARTSWGFAAVAPQWAECRDRLMELDKRGGPALEPIPKGPTAGASRFIRTLGEHGADFEASFHGSTEEAIAAGSRIAARSPVIGYGGLIDYGHYYSEDPILALWTGLFLSGQGRPALARAEFTRAARLGCDAQRIPRQAPEAAPA
jgi:glycosyltransferase involved in cell wall biosynthesis